MATRRKPVRTLGEHAIFGDEEAAKLQSEMAELRAAVAELGQRVQSQFTTISAHAEIARQQAEFVRDEARADLERTRTLLIDLVERARGELITGGIRHDHASSDPTIVVHDDRLNSLDRKLVDMAGTVERCFDRQRVLADTIEALFDTVLAERRGEPVVALSLV